MREVGAPPRYWDAHTHLSAGAVDLLDGDLRVSPSGTSIDDALATIVAAVPAGAWVRPWGWDGKTVPADRFPAHPIVVTRRDGHAAWLNAAARAMLGRSETDPIVEESAFDGVRRRLPERSTRERLAAVASRLLELRASGVTIVDDMVEGWAQEIYARLRDSGELPLSVGLWLPESIEEHDAEAARRAFPPDDRTLAVRGIKLFLDGTLGGRTAALSSPYADDPASRGALRGEERDLLERVFRWTSSGWAVALHAIGDRAVGVALDALERAPTPAAGRHRIEHAQIVRRRDVARFAAAGVVASVQPGHWRDDRGLAASRLGDRPEVVSYPLRSLALAGVRLVFGSDWPVSDWEPGSILAAATDKERGSEALDAEAAVAWYTSRPPCPTPSSSKGSSSTASTA